MDICKRWCGDKFSIICNNIMRDGGVAYRELLLPGNFPPRFCEEDRNTEPGGAKARSAVPAYYFAIAWRREGGS